MGMFFIISGQVNILNRVMPSQPAAASSDAQDQDSDEDAADDPDANPELVGLDPESARARRLMHEAKLRAVELEMMADETVLMANMLKLSEDAAK